MKKNILPLILLLATANLANAQNVGIGTNTPGAKLHIIGNGVGSSTSTLILRNAGLDTLLRMLDNGNMTIGYTGTSSRTLALGGNGINFYTPGNGPYQGGIYPSSSGNSLVVSGANNLILQAEGGGVGIGTPSPASSAALEVSHPNKGILFPRVADTSSIATPVKGLVIFSNASNKLWYYNGSQWQSAGGGAGSGDLWYEGQDSVAYSAKSYLNIKMDPNMYYPAQANIQSGGSLLLQGKTLYSLTNPTAGQTYTMNNSASIQNVSFTFDSVGRVYDPGGTGNYLNNTQGNIQYSTSFFDSQTGYKITSTAADFGLGTGDTLWISSTNFPSCRTNYYYRIANTTINPGPMYFASQVAVPIYFNFRANGDGNNGKGFNLLVTRTYYAAPPENSDIGGAGPLMFFNTQDGSFAAGNNGTAVNGGIALGNAAFASAGIAAGSRATSTGNSSAAFGNNARASGQSATALGYFARATGQQSVAIGDFAEASGNSSVAIGNRPTASGSTSIAIGDQTNATGGKSFAAGYLNEASGEISSVFGRNNTAAGYAGTVVGIYNNPLTLGPQTVISSLTPLFMVGNGDDFSNRSNALIVLKNGNVGIGPNSLPSERLEIEGGNMLINNSSNTTIQFQAAGVDKAFVQLSGNNLRVGTNSSNSTANFIVRTNGSDQLTIFPSGNATLSGTLTQNSDARFKERISPINEALDKIMRLRGYQYYWKPELKKDKALQIGLIAQNVESVLPELVITAEDGMKSVAYQNLIPVLIEAIKEQQRQIEELKKLVKKAD